MNNRPLAYQGEEFEEPVLTPNILLRGKNSPVLEEDLEMVGEKNHQTGSIRTKKQGTAAKEILERICSCT